jgi:hypothetical protein
VPQIISSIASISRRLQRDVLYVVFKECEDLFLRKINQDAYFSEDNKDKYHYATYQKRINLIGFLKENKINYQEAFAYEFNGNYDYDGCLYIDIEFDIKLKNNQKDGKFKLLDEFLMSDDLPKDDTVLFYYKTIKDAQVDKEFDI